MTEHAGPGEDASPANTTDDKTTDEAAAAIAPISRLSWRARTAKERKIWRTGLLISFLLHLLVFVVDRMTGPVIPDWPFAAAGPRADDAWAAEGVMTVLQLSSAPPAAIVRPPDPVPIEEEVPEIEEIEPDDDPSEEEVADDVPDPGVGTTQGDGDDDGDDADAADAGIPTGTGEGDGGTTDEGLFRLVPAMPRGLIIPPTNSRLRGQEVEVWVFVNEQGRVVPDSTRLDPPTSDRRFNQEIMSQAAQWVFQPARQGGQAVASWFPYRISM